MTETQSGGSAASDGVHARLDDHEGRIAAVERRQDVTDSKLDGISRDLSAVRAEGNARALATASGIERLGNQFVDLTRQLATHTGAQEERNRIEQQKLIRAQTEAARAQKSEADANASAARVKIWIATGGFIVGALAGLGGMTLSSQTWDDYLFGNVHFLHRHHAPAPAPPTQQQASAYAIAPRNWEKS